MPTARTSSCTSRPPRSSPPASRASSPRTTGRSSAVDLGPMAQKPIGDALVDAGLLAPEQLQRALAHQRLTGRRLIDCLVELKLVEEKELLRIRAAGSGTRYVPSDRLAQL